MKKIRNQYNRTVFACYVGYIVQAIINNFAPLLFLTFERTYHLSTERIALLITINFLSQLLIDFLSAFFVPKFGERPCIIAAHIFASVGLAMLGFLPELTPSPYAGLIIAVVIYAVGSGLIEVLISPLVEACPSDNKEASMSLLHSFYCWGQVLVVALSTLFFVLAGIENWRILAFLWAAVPLANMVSFFFVPLASMNEEGKCDPITKTAKSGIFWILALLIFSSGAAEIGMSQWASVFAEQGLQIDKTAGDLLGPCLFAVFMGIARTFYGKYGSRIDLRPFMFVSAVLCVCSYLLTALTSSAVLGLVGCSLCGLSVGIMWPGTLSLAAKRLPHAGSPLFSFLALFGDFGCSVGPAVVGLGTTLQAGMLTAVIFPVILCVGIAVLWITQKKCV